MREAFGQPGEDALIDLLDNLRRIFDRVPPEQMRSPLTMLRALGSSPLAPRIASLGQGERLVPDAVETMLMGSATGTFPVIELLPDGSLQVVLLPTDLDAAALAALAADSVVYRYEGRTDRVLAGNHDIWPKKVFPGCASSFAVPTTDSLEDALVGYERLARDSQCYILQTVWEHGVNGPRHILVNKPERIMRRSLTQALSTVLGATASVRPEQNTDETKPVDIRIDWFGSKASALIEIKWLGRSLAGSEPATAPTYTTYSEGRARDGAQQLADYLDRERQNSSATHITGHLVIFDARRRNLSAAGAGLSEADARHFATAEIAYSPDLSKSRSDFARPKRFFLEPRPDHFKEAA